MNQSRDMITIFLLFLCCHLTIFTSAFTINYSPRLTKSTRRITTITQRWSSGNHDDDIGSSLSSSSSSATSIRFLGRGEDATIRPGVVLVAPSHEYNHFLLKSAVFIYAMGFNQYEEFVTRGVIIDHPTAFTIGEMTGGSVSGKLASNVLFQGGDAGNDTVMLLHCHGDSDSGIQCGEMIGNSGIYQGGLLDAMKLVDEGRLNEEGFKFFFNHVEFSEKELEAMLTGVDSDGDAWASMEVSSSVLLNNDFQRGDAWSFLRNQMKQQMDL